MGRKILDNALLTPSHWQFIIYDPQKADGPLLWNDQTFAQGIASGPNAIGIAVPIDSGRVIIDAWHGSANKLPEHDHAVSEHISVISGKLLIESPDETGLTQRIITLPAGIYRMIAYCAHVDLTTVRVTLEFIEISLAVHRDEA